MVIIFYGFIERTVSNPHNIASKDMMNSEMNWKG
jgi:hypothetical protein